MMKKEEGSLSEKKHGFTRYTQEIPVLTLFLVVFYIIVYFFNYGYSEFYGYPKLFINISLTSFFSPAFAIYCGVLFLTITFSFYKESGTMPFYAQAIWAALIFFALFLYIISDLDEYFYNNTLIVWMLAILTVSLIAFFNLISTIINNGDYKNFQCAINFVCTLFLIPFTTGWITAYSNTDIYISGNMYLLAKYDTSYVFGKCKLQHSVFYTVTPNEKRSFIALSKRENREINTCFRMAAKNSDNLKNNTTK